MSYESPNSLHLSNVNISRAILRTSFFALISEEEGHFHFSTLVRRSHVIREDEMLSAAAVVKLLYYCLTAGSYSVMALRADTGRLCQPCLMVTACVFFSLCLLKVNMK